MSQCTNFKLLSLGDFCLKSGRSLDQGDKGNRQNSSKIFGAAREETASSAECIVPYKKIRLPKPPISLIIVLLLICILVIGTPIIMRIVNPTLVAKEPVAISTSTIVSTLHSQQTLNVLEDTATGTYQVSDKQIYTFFEHEVQLPFLAKTVTVDYDYKITFGIDLGEITNNDIQINQRTISLVLNKPTDTVLMVYNEHARTDGGALINKSHPLDDAQKLDPSHEPLTNTLMKNTMDNLKQTNKYNDLQVLAMNNAKQTTVDLLTKTLGPDITVNISYR
ncbi:MAG: DUF4230 domain-containing protein [Desulfosporosinus sp.]|nr:DUF4230 domain-containing protein [Desulfosporosinus sp.]